MKPTSHVLKRKNLLCASILSIVCSTSAQAVITLTFSDNTMPLDPHPSTGGNLGPFTVPFTTTPPFPPPNPRNSEYRMVDPTNTIGGGGEKSILDGGEQWVFGDDINLTAVNGSDMTGGSFVPGSAAPTGDVGLHLNAPFFNVAFGFLAPIVGSAADTFYGGPGTISIDPVGNIITVNFLVLEAQWGGTHFPLGQLDDGVHGTGIAMVGNITNIVSAAGTTTFDCVLVGEHIIQAGEDPGSAGFSLWTTQWEMPCTGSAPDAVFVVAPDSPTSSPGTLNPTPGGPADGNTFDDGRISLAESETTVCGVDPGIVPGSGCRGSCFDFTVTGIPNGPASIQVTLPLTTAIPANAELRKCDGVWRPFNESGGDLIESAPGASGDCSTPGTYVAGLVQGNFCVRVTEANGGLNDLDKVALDTQLVDPVGVGILPASGGGGGLIAPEGLGSGGCSIASPSTNPQQRGEWWIIGGLLSFLGWRRRKVKQL